MKAVEILAPAGSYESLVAAVNAGADAVYMGGSRFGARAYADNPDEEQWLHAIDYAHLHGCKLYMTVNTLAKEEELAALYEYLHPYYKQGLDAVIVQDMGVFQYIKRQFPDLPIHASTQMTITGYHGAVMLKELGAARIVTARELSLAEIQEIHERVPIEIESFVHGALCYCYSGQCLMSSFIGGRSGNRGRCAQPCRLPYEVLGNDKKQGDPRLKKEDSYVLSLKDLCTLDLIPDMLEAGVYSMKIEGRMKSPRYTAGVVSIYRKYVDHYLANGRSGYQVDPKDRTQLLELFDRGGLTDGYYRQHNGREMVALAEKPLFRAANQELFDYLDNTYVKPKKQEPVSGYVELTEGMPARLELVYSAGAYADFPLAVAVMGATVQTAKNQPLSRPQVDARMRKTGESQFWFEHLEVQLDGACFLPMQELNELRRSGLETLKEQLLQPYRRESVADNQNLEQALGQAAADTTEQPGKLHVSLEQPEQLGTILAVPEVAEVYLDATGFPADKWQDMVNLCHQAGKTCLLILPHIFRAEARKYFKDNLEILRRAGFDGLVLRTLEEVGFLAEYEITLPLVFDDTMYGMNHLAVDYFTSVGAVRQTLPVELNSRELAAVGSSGKELIVYGYLPAMVSAQCIAKTTAGCRHRPELLFLKDRKGKRFPVKNHCRFCYNTIYNTSPLSLLGMEPLINRLQPSVLRLQFTIESEAEIKTILHAFTEEMIAGRKTANPSPGFTRGHLKRGIE